MEEVRESKRAKISRDDDDYMPGNITEIELCNFMTFNKLTCKPGPRLNLVIGPNGSGKSSLVCAIALGLGGEPQLLGRATSIGAYVKRGEESGYIKICLRAENRKEAITITRKFDTSNKSEWQLNGKSAAKKDIVDVIRRFNIQVDNLTQFLPQDRVCEFAKLSPVQLLEETEKAVGDPKLPLQHRSLIVKSQEMKKFERAVESNKGSLAQLKALNADLERDVKRVRQREELLKKAESMKKKLPWLKYDIKKADYLEAKKHQEVAKEKLDEAAKALNKCKEPIEKLKAQKTAEEAEYRKANGQLDKNMKKRIQLWEKYDSLGVQIRGKKQEVEDLRRQEESRQQRLTKAREDLSAAEEELANNCTSEPPRKKLEQLSAQILELEEIANDIRSQKREKERYLNHHTMLKRQCVDRLKEMENANNKRLHALKNSGAEKIFEAYQLVQEHQSEFNKEVYGPVLLEVNVANKIHADYLEGHVSNYIWKAFITQDPDDRDLLVRNLKPYDVPVINHVGNENHRREPFHLTDEMRKIGISSRLDLVFEAPDAVKEVLIGQFGLDRSYIGSKETDEKADLVFQLGIMDVWTPENHYRWSRSRYGNHVSGTVDSVYQSRLLLCNLDSNEIDGVRSRLSELEATISTIETSLKALQLALRKKEDEAAGLQREREEISTRIQSEKRKRRELEQLVNQRKMKLKSIEREDDPDAERKYKQQVEEFKIQQLKCAVEIKNLLIDAVADRRSYAEKNMCSIELELKIKEMEGQEKQQEKLAIQASLFFDQCKKAVEKSQRDLAEAKKRAESVTLITPELKRAFMEMPTTVEELEAAIQDTVSEANAILFLNQNILEEYESRRRKIEELTCKHETDEKELNSRLAEVKTLKGSWLPTLKSLVDQINKTFSRNFQEMAVAGEVSLDEHDTDFDKYGILIKVKFRQTGQLQVLCSHHQSGGERSVSTILYLVSLQDLTNCPFRVVDEINQGMDPINERKMFQQLVRAASQPNTPQCFLLTPKLLPNLDYTDACSILTVMNGPWIEQPSKVWAGGENWRCVRGSGDGELTGKFEGHHIYVDSYISPDQTRPYTNVKESVTDRMSWNLVIHDVVASTEVVSERKDEELEDIDGKIDEEESELKDLERGEVGFHAPAAGFHMSRMQRLSSSNPLRLVMDKRIRVASPSPPPPPISAERPTPEPCPAPEPEPGPAPREPLVASLNTRCYTDKLSLIIFMIHMFLAVGLVGFLIFRGIAGLLNDGASVKSEEQTVLKYFLPQIETASLISITLAFIWQKAVRVWPKFMVHFIIWSSFGLSLSSGILLICFQLPGTDAIGILYIAFAIGNGLYACWVTQRARFCSKVFEKALEPVPKFRDLNHPTYYMLGIGFIWMSLWIVAVVGSLNFYYQPLIVIALVLSLAWTAEVMRNVANVTVSRVVALYYLRGMQSSTQFSFQRALTRNLGSASLASLFVPTIEALRIVARGLNLIEGEDEFMFCCAQCCLRVMESVFSRGNGWAYVQIAAYGKGFVKASQDTWELFQKKEIASIVDSDITSSVCFLTGVCSASVCTIVAAAWTSTVHTGYIATVSALSAFVGYLMTRIAMALPQACVGCYYVCFAENPSNRFFDDTIPKRLEYLKSERAEAIPTPRVINRFRQQGMGKWDRRYFNVPRRKKFRHEDYEDPSPSEGIGTTGVPSWELDYCKSAKIPFGKILASKRYIYCYPSVLDWDASACEDALRNAKQRYLAAITGLPCDHHPLPDPNMYIDEIDWNPYLDPELLAELELLRFDKAAREDEKSEESQSRELSSADDNPWEGKKRKDCSNGGGGLKKYLWRSWNESLDWQPRNGSVDFFESSTWSNRKNDEDTTPRFQKGNGNESWNQKKNKSSYNHGNESWNNNKAARNHHSEKSISRRPFHRGS